jgi:CDP-diacylglycerol--serine O-phosphatidyltransferase
MANRPRRKIVFFKGRKRAPGSEGFPDRQPRRKIRIGEMKKGIFILPSLLTLTSIFASFYAIICAIEGQFMLSGALILVAAFFDGIDGKVARLTKTTTRFGLELDSLADVISFGVAPAILMYLWALSPYGRIGWVGAFVFVACGALRLARFNIQSGSIDPKRFRGLPIPAAAVMVATTVLFFHKIGLKPADFMTPLLILTYVISFFMVSSIKFHAFKDLTLVKQNPFSFTVAFVLLLALIAASPLVVPFFISAAYLLSGPILTLVLYLRDKKKAKEAAPLDEIVEPKST